MSIISSSTGSPWFETPLAVSGWSSDSSCSDCSSGSSGYQLDDTEEQSCSGSATRSSRSNSPSQSLIKYRDSYMTQLALRVDELDSAPWSNAMSSVSVDSSHSSHIEAKDERIAELERLLDASRGEISKLSADMVWASEYIKSVQADSERLHEELAEKTRAVKSSGNIIKCLQYTVSGFRSKVRSLESQLPPSCVAPHIMHADEAQIARIVLDQLYEAVIASVSSECQAPCRAMCPTYEKLQEILDDDLSLTLPGGTLSRQLLDVLYTPSPSSGFASRLLARHCMVTIKRGSKDADLIAIDCTPSYADIAAFVVASGHQGLWSAEQSSQLIWNIGAHWWNGQKLFNEFMALEDVDA